MGSSGRGSKDSSSEGLEASVVIMNWKRPQNVRQILDRMVNYKAVKEILVWHCNPETVFTYDHPKVSQFDCLFIYSSLCCLLKYCSLAD
jgi:hypothetical protein